MTMMMMTISIAATLLRLRLHTAAETCFLLLWLLAAMAMLWVYE